MSQSNAAGRKTGNIEGLLEAQLAALSEEVARTLQSAAALTPQEDKDGWAKAAEIKNAVRLAKTSAQLTLALAKLKGETNLNINVRRGSGDLPPLPEMPHPDAAPMPPHFEGEPPLFTEEEWKSETLTNEELWKRQERLTEERARRAGWI